MADNSTLGRDMADFARALEVPESLDELLTAVSASAVRLIEGVDFADILLVEKGKFSSVGATDDLPIELDAVQQTLGEGPCLDSARTQSIYRADDLSTDTRWPRFAKAAVDSGIRSMLSLNLFAGKDTLGALNLFGTEPDAFDADDEDTGSILATHAAIALMGARKDRQFRSALATRDLIGQAKGMVMERYGLDAVRAFELLSSLSQNTNVTLVKVATRIVESGSVGGPTEA